MDYQNKTKEELIKELQELHQAHHSLKASYDKNITEIKQAEQALKDSKNLFSLFLQFSPIYVYIKEVSANVSRVITSSDNYIDMIGISSSDMKGKTMQELFPAEFAAKITQDDWDVVTNGMILQLEENFNNRYYTTIKFPIVREGKTLLAGYTIDVTERKQTEKMFQDIIEKNPISIQILDMEGYTIQVNSAFKKIFGDSPPSDYSIFKDTQLLQQGFTDAFEKIKKGEVVNFPNSYYNAHAVDSSLPNNPLWLKGVGFTLNLNSDSPGKIVFMHENITERILAEEAMIESEDKFRTIFENSIVGKSITYLNGKIKTNRAFCDIVGYTEEELSNLKWQTITHPEDAGRDEAIFNSILAGEKSYNRWEKRYIKKNGDIVWVDISTTLQRDKDGKPEYFITSIHDNTERKRAEETLRKSEELYRNLVEKLPDGVYKSTHDGKFIEVNPAMFNMLGYSSKEELMAIDIKTQLYFDIADRESLILKQTCAEVGVYPLKKKDGSAIWVEDNGWYNVDGNGNIISHEGILRDITERKLAEENLKESEERFKVLHNASFGGIGIHNKGIILECNQGLSEMTGYSLNELIGMNGILLIAPDFREFVMDKINTEFEKPYEAFGLRKNGEIYPIRISGKGVPYKGKKVRSVEFRDITEQKQAEIDLLTAKEAADADRANVTAIIEGTADNIWAFNRNFEILYINQVFQREFHQTFDVWLEPGVSLIESLPETLQPFWKPRYNRVLNNEQFTIEDAIDTGNGIIYIQVSFNPIIKNGKVVGGSCFGSNITGRKLAETALIHQYQMQEILMNIASKYINIPLTMVEATIQKSLEEIGRFANVDRVYIFDYNWDTDVCNNTHEWCDEGIEPQINELQHVPLNMITWQVEPHKKGEILYIADVLAMPKDDSFRQILEAQDIKSMMTIPMMKDQVCIGFIGFDSVKNYHNYTEKEKVLFTVFAQMLVNIYNRKILDQDLIEAKYKAEESNRLKSAFLANMSHEIRTPMNGILGFADLLKKQNLTGKQQKEYIRIIEKSGLRMLNIINDIIDISKIEAGQMKIDLKESNINEQIEYIYTFFKPEVEAKGMKLSFKNALTSNEAIVKTDREKVYAILTNLVKNAIKYSEKGSIEFGYEIVDTRNALYLQFYVKDTGIGIPKNRQEAIFERFIQADIADKMARQGAGLGLSITKAYLEMLGGKIWVESEEDLGSTFYFTLPYAPKANENEFTKNEYLPSDLNNQFDYKPLKLKLLIAEDDETSELLISYMMDKYCKEILKVRTGIEAIEFCRKNSDIDLIMMDIQMPEMNGYEATKQIRQFNKNVVIIAQTAYGLSGDKEKAIEAGCNDYISKPISNSLLKKVIQKHFIS